MGGWVGLRASLDAEDRRKCSASVGDRTPVVQYVVRHYIQTELLFNYMFQNFHAELVPRATGSVYQNMYIAVFKRECVIIVCKAYSVQ
jgi:hypothetical protein